MTRRPVCASLVAAFVLAFSSAIHAQGSDSEKLDRVRAGVAPTTCTAANDTTRLGVLLPEPVLEYLDRAAASPFVHAFLIGHLAQHGNPQHWLVKCANAFVGAQLSDLEALRYHQIEAQTLLRALRSEAEAVNEQEKLSSSARQTLRTIVPRMIERVDSGSLEVYATYLRASQGAVCKAGSSLCTSIKRIRAQIDSISSARKEKEGHGAAVETAEQEARKLRVELDAAIIAAAQDSLRLDSIVKQNDTIQQAAQKEVFKRRQEARDSIEKLVNTAVGHRDALAATFDDVQANVQKMTSNLTHDLSVFAIDVSNSTESVLKDPIVVPEAERITTKVTLIENTPPPLAESESRGRSANIALELTDFVIERAKQELVLAYLGTLYGWIQNDPLLRNVFQQTYGLMRGVATDDTTKLSIVAAGRIPLGVWRATVVSDFEHFPIAAVQTAPGLLCRTGKNQETVNKTCLRNFARMQPIALMSQRLVAGDQALDVLRDAPQIVAQIDPDVAKELTSIAQGIRLVGALAQAFHTQGVMPSADPLRHPYVISLDALTSVSEKQQQAFLRVFLLQATPTSIQSIPDVDATSLMAGLRVATQAIESLATIRSTDNANQAIQVVRLALNAVGAGVELGIVLSPDSVDARLKPMRDSWANFNGAIQALVAKDYGLAMSRTVVLVGGLSQRPMPRSVLTLAGLGASLAEAQTGSQVRQAFEAAASPVGGWQAKRYRQGGKFSLTAYPGLAGGAEWLDGGGKATPTFGASLPFGVEYQLLSSADTAVKHSQCRVFCSVGLFLPIIDTGALLSYRLGNEDEAESVPNATFRQVFAPGAYIALGVGRSPVSILLGGQFMPELRKVTDLNINPSGHAWRAGGGIVVDVMLFEF